MARCRALAGRLRFLLGEIPGVAIHDLGEHPASIVTFSVRGLKADAIKARLVQAGINVSVSKPSSTLLDAMARELPVVVRASPHYHNTETEISQAATANPPDCSRDELIVSAYHVIDEAVRGYGARALRLVRCMNIPKARMP